MSVHFPESNFGSILEDQDGNVWFGTRGSGTYKFDGLNWTQHLSGMDIRPTIVDKDGRIWAITDDNGVLSYDGDTWTRYKTDDGLASNSVYGVIEARDGTLWFATEAGASQYTIRSTAR